MIPTSSSSCLWNVQLFPTHRYCVASRPWLHFWIQRFPFINSNVTLKKLEIHKPLMAVDCHTVGTIEEELWCWCLCPHQPLCWWSMLQDKLLGQLELIQEEPFQTSASRFLLMLKAWNFHGHWSAIQSLHLLDQNLVSCCEQTPFIYLDSFAMVMIKVIMKMKTNTTIE